ncbi:ankyrin repeat domain-containing protein [Pseudomonas berkeleyensis]|uniref:Ankyrin repeat domain-containing protein n=1 Tax=Pseudomonas berkeleyensis TaxID=2726956 RepID=A0A7G5DII0_9PSED|nr:ankyrin repeat domain-containing protein [Pseudomonas berkeleyensis]QMV61555.1 ankyrin repeat domain-containing protein [Pseudomonas berkeleyensis]WSO36987.1 ankyrin repeat domain-containing protein [Pseudomonas berkeleyensis]
MNDLVVLPTPSNLFRALLTATGYRPFLESKGLGRDIDHLALEERPAGNFNLLENCQAQWLRAIRDDAGADWSNLIESAWIRYGKLLRSLARKVDTTGMIQDRARSAIFRMLVIPEISGFVRRIHQELPLPDMRQWWDSPFASWLIAAQQISSLSAQQLLARLANHADLDERTLERWQQGNAIGKSLWPYRDTVMALVGECQLPRQQIERLSGWLIMVVAIQSLPADLRDTVKRDFFMQGQLPLRTEEQFIVLLKREAADWHSLPIRDQIAPVLNAIQRLFANAVENHKAIRDRLDWLRSLCERTSPEVYTAHEYLWRWFSARLAANLGEKDNALKLYASACHAAWWRAGSHQHPLIHEALCYAVGVGDQVQANHYWDKCFLLGLNNPPKRELDEQAMRLISFEFERLFAPQKATQRIPPAMRYVVGPFVLSPKDLANPNRKRAQSDGRVRYTPLMDAVLMGTLEDVKELALAGGDPNVFIPESGENALIMALRRGHDRKDPEILQYLLSLDIAPETANRSASSKRETPLQIAMNMADAKVVGRLISLGADMELPCFNSPSALVYAMALLHDSVHVNDPAQLRAYLEGRVPADSFDAKNGAILDCELPAQRLDVHAMLVDPQKKLIFEAVKQHYSRTTDERREVVMTLLDKKADPNRRYPDFNGHRHLWTPTLFAAQLGDLDVLKAMIAAGGNPWLSLDEDRPGDERNALWVAVSYKRQRVIEYLLTLLPEHATN